MITTSRTARRPVSRLRLLVVGTALGAAALAGCGDDDESAQDRYCAAGESLESSVAALTDLDLIAEGTNGLEAALTDVRDDVEALRDAASETTEDDVAALEQSVDDLRSAIESLGGEISAENVSGVATAIESTATSAAVVFDTLSDC
jgi:hypothetical protein